MSVDAPARIAILGAGPIGLEATLYARYLGYTVDLYERGRAAENLRRWGHVQLFTPWEMNASSLGIAALRTQDEAWRPARAGEQLTGRELVDRYFLPLAQSDLIVDSLQEQVEVVAVGREGLLKGDLVLDERRIDVPFRLLVRDADGTERVELADVVFDCTGTYGTPCRLGNGGLPALGELALAAQIEYGLPDILGEDREQYAGRHTLVVGGGYSAATSVTQLARLAADVAGTRVTWVTRRDAAPGSVGPLEQRSHDPLPSRDALAQQANLLTLEKQGPVTHYPATFVERIERDDAGRFQIELTGRHAGYYDFDRVVANVGYRPDRELCRELQLQESFAGEGPMKLSAALLKQPVEAQETTGCGAATLLNPEPDFYVLGSKSYGRSSNFLLAAGREQIREVFSILGDREGLNLYATHP